MKKPQPFIKGMFELLTLVELKRAPHSGKDLADDIAFLTDGHWRPSPGTLYPALRQMEAKGCIRPVLSNEIKGRREIIYEITPSGLKRIERNRTEIIKQLDGMMRMMTPLMLRLMHEFSDEEIREIMGEFKELEGLRDHIFAMPAAKRRATIKRLVKSARFVKGVLR